MKINNEIHIPGLCLDMIKMKLMHRASGEGWSQERANAVEREYRRFLYLMKIFPAEETAPSVDVDTFWHYHILDTMQYAADCESLFGYFLHHFPYVGLRIEDNADTRGRAGERMRELYEQTFGASATAQAAFACCGASARLAYCGASAGTTRVSYCGAAGLAAKVAYCGAAGDASTALYCGPSGDAPRARSAASDAYCGATTRAAHCGATGAAPRGRAQPQPARTA